MTTPIRAIETSYAGCRFRSRLEARWAVFFDTLGIAWQYEVQGYVAGTYEPRAYLPDFWLPGTGTWAEVKGSDEAVDWDWLADACDWNSVLPGVHESHGTTQGLLLLGSIPAKALTQPWKHPCLQQHKGINVRFFSFTSQGGLELIRGRDAGYGAGGAGITWEEGRPPAVEGVVCCTPYNPRHPIDQRVVHAYAAARSARFEHGQSGAFRRGAE